MLAAIATTSKCLKVAAITARVPGSVARKEHIQLEILPAPFLVAVYYLHNSSPFLLFFARQCNGLSNLCDEENNLLSQEQIVERLEYMTKVVLPAIKEKSDKTQQRMIERFNRTVLLNEFPDGAKVMTLDPILGDKLTSRYEGPYTVVRRNAGGAYILRDGTGALLERSYAPSQLKLVLDDTDESDIYEVEKIITHRPHLLELSKKG